MLNLLLHRISDFVPMIVRCKTIDKGRQCRTLFVQYRGCILAELFRDPLNHN